MWIILDKMDIAPILGLLGSITASSLFLPQVWISFKTKRTKDLAWLGITLGMANGLIWATYGFLKNDPFIYVTNSLFFLGAFMLMLLKKKYG